MNNIKEFESLCWIEASLYSIDYKNSCLSFIMTDLISYTPKVTYEYVEIAIQKIKSLNMSLCPFVNSQYIKEEHFTVGNLNYFNSLGFEGVLKNNNPFSKTIADYFWITADFEANNIIINRTGKKFELLH